MACHFDSAANAHVRRREGREKPGRDGLSVVDLADPETVGAMDAPAPPVKPVRPSPLFSLLPGLLLALLLHAEGRRA